jgi:hypothetical protein
LSFTSISSLMCGGWKMDLLLWNSWVIDHTTLIQNYKEDGHRLCLEWSWFGNLDCISCMPYSFVSFWNHWLWNITSPCKFFWMLGYFGSAIFKQPTSMTTIEMIFYLSIVVLNWSQPSTYSMLVLRCSYLLVLTKAKILPSSQSGWS